MASSAPSPTKRTTPKKVDTFQAFAQELAAGRHDDRIGDLMKVITDRMQEASVVMAWRITVGGLSVRDDDLTLKESDLIERGTGQNWQSLNPTTSAQDCLAILAVLYHTRLGLDADEAAAEAGKLTLGEITRAITTEQVNAGPLGQP
jgi:hypothetical protein